MNLSVSQVAEMFAVNITTIYSWDKKGILKPTWVFPGTKSRRDRFYSEESVKALFESCYHCEDRDFTMISVNDVADMLGVSKQRVYVLESRGDISAAWVSPGGRRYYSKEKIQEFFNSGYQINDVQSQSGG